MEMIEFVDADEQIVKRKKRRIVVLDASDVIDGVDAAETTATAATAATAATRKAAKAEKRKQRRLKENVDDNEGGKRKSKVAVEPVRDATAIANAEAARRRYLVEALRLCTNAQIARFGELGGIERVENEIPTTTEALARFDALTRLEVGMEFVKTIDDALAAQRESAKLLDAYTCSRFRCARCGQRKTRYSESQSRLGLDEAMTLKIVCVCGNHWSI